MLFADRNLSRRMEAAEGYACAQFAVARQRLFPDCGSEAICIGGADVVYDGVGSPTTQTFGLGMHEAVDAEMLDSIEAFFAARHSTTQHEVSPFAGADALQLLAGRGYQPIEINSVLYLPLEAVAEGISVLGNENSPEAATDTSGDSLCVRVIEQDESRHWTEISVRGWAHEHPGFEPFMRDVGALLTSRQGSACFLAEIAGIAGAAGALSIHQGVALLAGAATVPEFRRRGLQSALLKARLDYARQQGCDLAMIVTELGSNSQRNAQRQGFHIAYTRLKLQKQ